MFRMKLLLFTRLWKDFEKRKTLDDFLHFNIVLLGNIGNKLILKFSVYEKPIKNFLVQMSFQAKSFLIESFLCPIA